MFHSFSEMCKSYVESVPEETNNLFTGKGKPKSGKLFFLDGIYLNTLKLHILSIF